MGVNESAFCRTADEVYCDIYQKLKTFGENVFGRNGQTKELSYMCFVTPDIRKNHLYFSNAILSISFLYSIILVLVSIRFFFNSS